MMSPKLFVRYVFLSVVINKLNAQTGLDKKESENNFKATSWEGGGGKTIIQKMVCLHFSTWRPIDGLRRGVSKYF